MIGLLVLILRRQDEQYFQMRAPSGAINKILRRQVTGHNSFVMEHTDSQTIISRYRLCELGITAATNTESVPRTSLYLANTKD